MPKRKQKKYNRPKKLFDSARILEENALVNKYGLKNKREIWKANYAIDKIRNTAKKLITAPEEDKESFIKRLKAKGFEAETIADVLGLDNEDYLKRRLESVVTSKGLAKTPKQARQFITHRHITINGNIIDAPSHITTLDDEANIAITLVMATKKELTKEEKEILQEVKEAAKETGTPIEGEEESKDEDKSEEEKA